MTNKKSKIGEKEIEVIIIRGLMSFIKYIREDESFHLLFLDYYEEILLSFGKISIINYQIYPYQQLTKEIQIHILNILFHHSTNNNEGNESNVNNKLEDATQLELRYIDKR